MFSILFFYECNMARAAWQCSLCLAPASLTHGASLALTRAHTPSLAISPPRLHTHACTAAIGFLWSLRLPAAAVQFRSKTSRRCAWTPTDLRFGLSQSKDDGRAANGCKVSLLRNSLQCYCNHDHALGSICFESTGLGGVAHHAATPSPSVKTEGHEWCGSRK